MGKSENGGFSESIAACDLKVGRCLCQRPFINENYCINTSVTHYYLLCFNGNESRVLIRDVRGVNARLLLMFITRHHAKHMLNCGYLTAAGIMHSVLA